MNDLRRSLRRNPLGRYGFELGLILVGVMVLSVLGPSPNINAHGETVESDPAPGAILQQAPETVRVSMSAPLAEGSFVQVLAPDFSRVDEGGTRIDPEDPLTMQVRLKGLSPGGYTVQWTAVDEIDGHRTHGSFAFDLVDAGPLEQMSSPRRFLGLLLLSTLTIMAIRRIRPSEERP